MRKHASRFASPLHAPLLISALLIAGCNKPSSGEDSGPSVADGPSAPSSPDPSNPDPFHPDPGEPTPGPEVPQDPVADAPLHVIMEIDRMVGATPLQPAQVVDGENVSLSGIYGEANVRLEIVESDSDLPALDRIAIGDLHGLMLNNRDTTLDADLEVYCIVGLSMLERPGRGDTLGVMFDYGQNDTNDVPREAFAVFSGVHGGPRASAELLLTTAHELAHCFNIHHNDWEGSGFKHDATVESYALSDTVRWGLSEQSKKHLRGHPTELVHFGPGSLPFTFITQEHADGHQSEPDHGAFQVVDRVDDAARTRGGVFDSQSAVRADGAALRRGAGTRDGLKLELKAPKTSYELGEPIVVDAVLTNTGDTAVPTSGLLDPMYGFLNLTYAEGDRAPRPYLPPIHGNARLSNPLMLEPGESLSVPCSVFFGSGGWVFETAGVYSVQARFYDDPGTGVRLLHSDPIEFRVTDPSAASRRLSRLALNEETGLFLYMNGGEHLERAVSNLQQIASSEADEPQVNAAKYALAVSALNTRIDPKTKAVISPEEQVSRAQFYLDGILESELADGEIIYAQRRLADELESSGKPEEAERVRFETLEKYWDREEALDRETLKQGDLERILKEQSPAQMRMKTEQIYRRDG